jgi:hypothetical protein
VLASPSAALANARRLAAAAIEARG